MALAVTADAAALFHALSDPTRLGILGLLRRGEQCVCELQVGMEAAQSRLSFHLRVLKDAGLVTDRREGRWVYYSARGEALDRVSSALDQLRPDARQLLVMSGGTCCD